MSGDHILITITEQFPEQASVIKNLFMKKEEFREVCEDYVLCLHTLNKMQSEKYKRKENQSEYEAVLQDLEIELFRMIEIYRQNTTE